MAISETLQQFASAVPAHAEFLQLEHRQDDRRLDVEQHQTNKGDQRADHSGKDGGGEAIPIFQTNISELLAREPVKTVLKFGDKIGLAVLPGSELEPAEKLARLMHELSAHFAELRAQIMRPPEHYKAHGRANSDQNERDDRQQRREQKGNDDLSPDDDH